MKDKIFGLRPVIEAVEAGKEIEKVFLKTGMRGDLAYSLINMLKERSIPFQFVPIEKLNRINSGNHQGVIALTAALTYQKIEDIIPTIYEDGKTPLIIIMDSITDVRNFGAISRTAECAGADAIIVPLKGGALIGPDAIKTSAGALHKIPVCRSENLESTIGFLKNCGLKIIAATEKGSNIYHKADLAGPAVLILGSEDRGISDSLLNLSDVKVQIPIFGTIDSLNVSAAASVLIYEIIRQREG